MKILEILIYILLIAFCMVFFYGAGLFIIDFFGATYDILTGSNDYFMWSLE